MIMTKKLILSSSPHIHSGRSTSAIMRDVLIALLPAAMAGTVIFGLRSLAVIAACCIGCVGFEFLFNLICKKDQTVGDLSALVTGLLLALNLPSHTPIWQCLIGAFFAIVIVKCLFGGLGCNPVNPAITARVFMLVSFGALATPAFPKQVDAVAGATPLVAIAEGNQNFGYGDAAAVANGDNILVMAVAGNVFYAYASSSSKQRTYRIYSTDNGDSWTKEEISSNLYTLFPNG